MTKTTRLVSGFLAFIFIISTLMTLALPLSAATCSSGTKTRTITVSTKANYWYPGGESVTLSQTKGVRTLTTRNFFTGKTSTKTRSCYGDWDITVRATDGSHSFTKNFSGSSIKLNLKPNKTYNITVSWDSQADLLDSLSKGNFTKNPTWKVKSTWKVTSIY